MMTQEQVDLIAEKLDDINYTLAYAASFFLAYAVCRLIGIIKNG